MPMTSATRFSGADWASARAPVVASPTPASPRSTVRRVGVNTGNAVIARRADRATGTGVPPPVAGHASFRIWLRGDAARGLAWVLIIAGILTGFRERNDRH